MPEEVLFESESEQSREEIAASLRAVADKLADGEAISLTAGTESVSVNPPARPTFEVKVEREGVPDSSHEVSIEFELEWHENGDDEPNGTDTLEIE